MSGSEYLGCYNMRTYKQELRTILFVIQGSPWAVHGGIQDVIEEYWHLQNAARTPTQSRRVSLQIFHASRAIDSLLAHVAEHERQKIGAPPEIWTLGRSRSWIQRNRVSGSLFDAPTNTDIKDITTDRNKYLHRANLFPGDAEMQRFINKTIRAIAMAVSFHP
jgi:hypothetical protein